MPALPVVPKVIKTALIWSDGINTDIVTRFYIEYGGSAPGPSDLNSYCASVRAGYAALLAADTSAALTLGRVHAIDLSSATGAEGDDSTSVVGTATDPPNALDVSVVVSYEFARRYRGGHCRGYWPLLTSAQLANPQRWDGTAVSNLHTDLESFFADVLAAGWSGAGTLSQVNVSYFHGFTVVTNPTTGRARNVPTVRATPLVDAITSRIVRSHVGTQRRRLQY